MMHLVERVSLVHGWLSSALPVLAAVGLAAGVARTDRRWWSRTVPWLVALSTAVVATAAWWVRHSGAIVDHYPPTFGLWIGIGVLSALIAAAGWSSAPRWQRVIAVVTAPLTLASAFLLINAHYAYWPTVGDLLGRQLPNEVSQQALTDLLRNRPNRTGDDNAASDPSLPGPTPAEQGGSGAGVTAAAPADPGVAGPEANAAPASAASAAVIGPAGRIHRRGSPPRGGAPRAAAMTASAPAPLQGVLAPLDIPDGTSGFAHRQGTLYLPPGFSAAPAGQLPVIVMLGGTPGGPQDWARAGFAARTADAYATDHHGLAPILALVDGNGSLTADTECVDGPAGEAETFLAVDVPHYLSGLLHVPLNPGEWGIGGFSEGGTCAFELALRHPDVYGTFLDIAGDRAPNLGSDDQTLEKLYGGDREAMAAHDPATLLRSHRFEGVSGWFLAGVSDSGHVGVAHRLAGVAHTGGMAVTERILPGGHSWGFAAAAFRAVLPFLAAHFGVSPMAPPGSGTGRGAQTA